jgi:hypothetical protein
MLINDDSNIIIWLKFPSYFQVGISGLRILKKANPDFFCSFHAGIAQAYFNFICQQNKVISAAV